MKTMMMALFMTVGLTAQASLLTLTPGNKKIEGVTLNQTAQITGSNATMSLVGAGLRQKTVLFVPVNVYVTELFANEPTKYSRDASALTSLEQSTIVAIRLTFLRNVDAATVASSYRDAFIENSVSLKDPAIATFLTNVKNGGDAEQGKSLVILLVTTKEGGTNLYYEDTKGQQSSLGGDRSLQQKVLSIWLGEPADDGLKDLKSSLLKAVY